MQLRRYLFAVYFSTMGLLLIAAAPGCSQSEPEVIEPTNDEQLELMRASVDGETDVVAQADAERDE